MVHSELALHLRISGQGTHLDWTWDRPIFSARLERRGSSLLVTETCREGGSVQPPYEHPYTVDGDRLTLYDGLWVMVFRRESP